MPKHTKARTTAHHRDPYVIRARRTRAPIIDADSADAWMAYGYDVAAGVEVRIQTERGALSLKVSRNDFGDEIVALRAFPHTDFAGRRVGLDSVLWQGSIDGQLHGQQHLMGVT